MNIYCDDVKIDLDYETPKVILKDQKSTGLYKVIIEDGYCTVIEIKNNRIVFTSNHCIVSLTDRYHGFYCLVDR